MRPAIHDHCNEIYHWLNFTSFTMSAEIRNIRLLEYGAHVVVGIYRQLATVARRVAKFFLPILHRLP